MPAAAGLALCIRQGSGCGSIWCCRTVAVRHSGGGGRSVTSYSGCSPIRCAIVCDRRFLVDHVIVIVKQLLWVLFLGLLSSEVSSTSVCKQQR